MSCFHSLISTNVLPIFTKLDKLRLQKHVTCKELVAANTVQQLVISMALKPFATAFC